MKKFSLVLAALAALAPAPCASEQERRVVVIAHRGEHLSHPENTLPAFEAAIDAGADYFECDVRTTADGRLVLMHDSSVERTTGAKGKVSELTFEQIRSLRAGGAIVPTFEEALNTARGRIGVYVDWKDAATDALIAAIEHAGMGDRVVIYGPPAKLRDIVARRPAWRVMPEAVSPAALRSLADELRVRVAAFDSADFNPPTIEVARQAGIDVYVDRLGAADNEHGWDEALRLGATGIQTDRPVELVRYLRSKRLP